MSYEGRDVENFTQLRTKRGKKKLTPRLDSFHLRSPIALQPAPGSGVAAAFQTRTWRLCFTGHQHVGRPVMSMQGRHSDLTWYSLKKAFHVRSHIFEKDFPSKFCHALLQKYCRSQLRKLADHWILVLAKL